MEFSKIIKRYEILEENSSIGQKYKILFKEALASCHSLSLLNNKIVGDEMEVVLFNETNCIL